MKDPSFWSDVVTRVLSTYAVVIFAMWWSGFIVALVMNLEWLDLVWNWVRGLPLVAQITVWVLFLPGMVGLWIWESSYPALIRLLAFGGIVGGLSLLCPASYKPCDRQLCSSRVDRVERGHEME